VLLEPGVTSVEAIPDLVDGLFSIKDPWSLGGQLVRVTSTVSSVEMHIASRLEDNRPLSLRVSLGAFDIVWGNDEIRGPGVAPPESGTLLPGIEDPDEPPTPTRLWGYVTRLNELVLLSAADLRSARRAASAWAGMRVASGDIEPVERLELELIPYGDRYVPLRYLLTAFGHTVGWPRRQTYPMIPDPSAPDDPLHAEARLPIPTYERTDARTAPQPLWPRSPWRKRATRSPGAGRATGGTPPRRPA
jgi:hypothetical protein